MKWKIFLFFFIVVSTWKPLFSPPRNQHLKLSRTSFVSKNKTLVRCLFYFFPVLFSCVLAKQIFFSSPAAPQNLFSPNQRDCNIPNRCGIYALGNFLAVNQVSLDPAYEIPVETSDYNFNVAKKNIDFLLGIFPQIVQSMRNTEDELLAEYPLEGQDTGNFIEATLLQALWKNVSQTIISPPILSPSFFSESIRQTGTEEPANFFSDQIVKYLAFLKNTVNSHTKWEATDSFFIKLSNTRKATCLLNIGNIHWVCLDVNLTREEKDWIILRDSMGDFSHNPSSIFGTFTGRGKLPDNCELKLMDLLSFINLSFINRTPPAIN